MVDGLRRGDDDAQAAVPEEPGGERTNRVVTVPNALCVIRLLGSIVLVVLACVDRGEIVLWLFIGLAMTDWLDGKLAILLKQKSVLGARLDSWADAALSLMRYNVDPGKLQCAIRQIFRHATSRVVVPGVEVVPVPLFEVLDARDEKDYEQRVEPSVVGGRKMAAAFHLRLQDENELSTRR